MRVVGVEEGGGEVADGEDVGDIDQPVRQGRDGDEHAGDEIERQHHALGDGLSGVLVADDGGRGEAEAAEGRGADDNGEGEGGGGAGRDVGAEGGPAHGDEHDRGGDGDDGGGERPPGDEGGGRHRGGAAALEHAGLTLGGDGDDQVDEGGGDDAEGYDPGHVGH